MHEDVSIVWPSFPLKFVHSIAFQTPMTHVSLAPKDHPVHNAQKPPPPPHTFSQRLYYYF